MRYGKVYCWFDVSRLLNCGIRLGTVSGIILCGLVPCASQAADSGSVSSATGDRTIEEVRVTAHRRDYLSASSRTALGLDLSLFETPAAVSVIPQDLLLDQQVNNVDDALRNVAGVTKFKTGNGGEEKFSIRGFDASQSIYKDGARINNPLNASNIPSTETANIERIDVLKGPSALLYGQGEPGGVINYVTKRPEFEQGMSVEIIGGSDDFYKAELDITGPVPLGDGETLAYRLVGAYQDTDSYRDEVFRKRLLLNPSLALQFGDSTRLNLSYEYIDDDYTQDRGQVLDGNIIDGYYYSDRLDSSQFFGIPNHNDKTEAESQRIHAVVEHEFGEYWQVEASYARTDNDKVNVDSSPRFITRNLDIIGPPGSPVADLVLVQPRMTDGTGKTQRVEFKNILNFQGPAHTEHKLLASVTWEDFTTRSENLRGDRNVFFNVATGDYFTQFTQEELNDPDITRATESVVFRIRSRGTSTNQDFNELGINVLDYIRFGDRFGILVGGRYSDFEDKNGDFTDDKFSFRGGLVFTPADSLSTYLSYSQGYTPSGGLLGMDDRTVNPQTSEAWEIGFKWALLDERLLLTGALYTVDLEDVPYVANPFDSEGNPTQSGDIRYDNIGGISSDGGEVEVVGNVTEYWRIRAGYSYIDNGFDSDGVGEFGAQFTKGNRLPGIARHNFNMFTFYEFPVLDGLLGLGGGVFYQGDVFVSYENRAKYGSWEQVDVAGYYKRGPWKLQANVRNLFDKEYRQAQAFASELLGSIRVGTAAPRTFAISAAYEF